MALLRKAGEFIFGGQGLLALILAGGLGLVGLWQWDKQSYGVRQAAGAVAKIERATNAAVSNVNSARAGVRSDGVRGQRDPYTADK